MALLSNNIRQQVCDIFAQDISVLRASLGNLSKIQLKAAIDAADSWADSNASSFNSALPVEARTALSSSQKAQLLAYTILRRYKEDV